MAAKAPNPIYEAVVFHSNRQPGFVGGDILTKGPSATIEGANDLVMQDAIMAGYSKINVAMNWHGYSVQHKITIPLFSSPGKPITRAQLAQKVLSGYSGLFLLCEKLACESAMAHLRIGPGALTVHKVMVMGVRHKSGDLWMAEAKIVPA